MVVPEPFKRESIYPLLSLVKAKENVVLPLPVSNVSTPAVFTNIRHVLVCELIYNSFPMFMP